MIKTGLKQGFTLAEVLTTLMVIGVVAAMTIPTLLNSTDDQQHRVALKKAVSVLSQAIQLNVAKEIEGPITSSATLCDFFAKSMAGTCSEGTTGTTEGIVTMTTADGMQYGFVFRGTGSEEYNDFSSICGSSALATTAGGSAASADITKSQEAWSGKNQKCIILVDTNGGKTTTGFSSDSTLTKNAASDAIPTTVTSKRDQFALIVTAAGVYPAITSSHKANAARGYKFLYGSDAKTPWNDSFDSTSDSGSST